MQRDAFVAIADPTRRQIIELLSHRPLTVNEVADNFADMSRQAVSKHLDILAESGLLAKQKEGRKQYCYVQLSNLREVNEWVGQYEQFWNQKLDQLADYLDRSAEREP